MEASKREQMLREEKIGKLLLKMSLPAIIGMMFGALYNIVDTIFVGRGVNAFAIGGLTISFPIQMFIVALATMIGVGVQANISIFFGAGEMPKANKYAGNSYVLIFLISTLITILGIIFIVPIVKLFGASDTLLPYAKDYMSIIFLGTIVSSLTTVNNSILRSEGNVKLAMVVMVAGTLLNIILDPIFIFTFHLGIKGAAIATVISQYISFAIGVYYMISGKSIIRVSIQDLRLQLENIKNIIRLGFPSFIRQFAGSLIAIFLNNSIVFYGGDVAISAFGVINRIMMFMLLPMFGVIQGFQPIVGFNYGAKDFDRVKEVVFKAIQALVTYCLIAVTCIMIFNVPIFKLFTNNQEVISVGSSTMKILFLGIPIIGVQIIASAFFQSIGKAKPALFLSLLRQVIILLPLILIMPKVFNLGLNGIWYSIPAADISSSLISIIIIKIQLDKLKQELYKMGDNKDLCVDTLI